jgi:hypothetical protein
MLPVFGQQKIPNPTQPKTPETLPQVTHHRDVRPEEFARPTKHILFLFDSSGSMDANQIGTAIEFVLDNRSGVAAAPFDDFHIALATFGTGVARWEGAEDIDPATNRPISQYGWAAMPSEDNLTAARAWISANLDGGSTNFIPGIRHCFNSSSGVNANLAGLQRPVTVNELTILIISDGEFHDKQQASNVIAELQKHRRANNLPEAMIGFVGIQVDMPDTPTDITGHSVMIGLATEHAKLGYLRIEFTRREEEDED